NALSIPPLAPPPWLINMQRYGPPPSYSDLAIPGLNAPIPHGAQWGYHPGGWGRPPVDESGHPLYGDVFAAPDPNATQALAPVSTGPIKYWGDLEVIESSDEESEAESEAEEEEEEEMEEGGQAQAVDTSAKAAERTVELTDEQLRSGMASMVSGLETPSILQLRKQAGGEASSEASNKSLYTILPEQAATRLDGFMASQYTYDMSKALDPTNKSAVAGANTGKKSKVMGTGVDIALDASEIEGLDQDELQARYEEAAAASAGGGGAAQEDLSDMVAEHAASQTRKRKTAAPTPAPKRRLNK
ncbi:hypothetical protein GGI21_006844, partial [Coemansia aciculifera]